MTTPSTPTFAAACLAFALVAQLATPALAGGEHLPMHATRVAARGAQSPFVEADSEYAFVDVEQSALPTFDLRAYLTQNLSYPTRALRAGIQGRVVVTFTVSTDGSVVGAHITKSLGYGADEEALRVVRAMPAWQPARQGGRPVATQLSLPIRFAADM